MPKYTFFHIDKTEDGITQGHAKGKVPSIPDYTIISRRINRLDIKINMWIIKIRILKTNTSSLQ